MASLGILERLHESALPASLGGVILGVTATTFLATTGRLVGLSGIFDGAFSKKKGQGWRVVFLSGFTVGSIVGGILYPAGVDQTGSPVISRLGLVISGLLVGLGTRLGNGCTSGHGLCGLPRLSRRSLVATLTFFTSGVGTASVITTWRAQGNGLPAVIASPEAPSLTVRSLALGSAAMGVVLTMIRKAERAYVMAHLSSFICGGAFAGGLVLSGMVRRAKVADFLALRPDSWDPALMLVLGFGVMTTLIGFPLVTRSLATPACHRPVIKEASGDGDAQEALKFDIPMSTELDLSLILGSWTFGVGWGVGGLCPGPAIVASVYGLPGPALYFVPSMLVGMKLASPLKRLDVLPNPKWLVGGGRKVASGGSESPQGSVSKKDE